MDNGIVFKYSRPSGSPCLKPSEAMTDALRQLGESSELKPLVAAARSRGRKVVVQVFQSSDGCPFLIHVAVVPADAA